MKKELSSKVTHELIIASIVKFHSMKGRIPFKNEIGGYKMARKLFGTWNKAIEAAGFEPNPVKFAMRHVAMDGHMCDSMAERIIDDWFYRREIHHERSTPYPDSKYKSDFKVGDVYIEFFGLMGNRSYDKKMERKMGFIRRKNINLIAIYPKDLRFGLSKILDSTRIV